jgi:tripartite-type tricarboxylate transporter receptor subunit TctC
MPRYIPGEPNIIVDAMPGAGTIVAANYVYSSAKPDGLTIGYVLANILLREMLGGSVGFDSSKFEWLGSPTGVTGICVTTTASGITSLEDWRRSREPVKLGAAGLIGDIAHDTAKILSHSLGLPLRLVTGHKGNPEMKLAAQRGETAGMCMSLEAANIVWGDALKEGTVRAIVQTGTKVDPAIPDVPLARQLAPNDEARALMRVGIELPASILRVFVLPPRTPKDRVETLRKAFMQTLSDPEFLKDAAKVKMQVAPTGGAEVERLVKEFHQVPAATRQQLKAVLGGT